MPCRFAFSHFRWYINRLRCKKSSCPWNEKHSKGPVLKMLMDIPRTSNLMWFNIWLNVLCKMSSSGPKIRSPDNDNSSTYLYEKFWLFRLAGGKWIEVSDGVIEECLIYLGWVKKAIKKFFRKFRDTMLVTN